MKFLTLPTLFTLAVATDLQMKGIVYCNPNGLRCFVNCGKDGEKCQASTDKYENVPKLDTYEIECLDEKCTVKCSEKTNKCTIDSVQSYVVGKLDSVEQAGEILSKLAEKVFA